MMAHVMEDCVKTKVICKRCKTKDLRESIGSHNCVIGFINQVKTGDADSYKTALNEMQTQLDGKISSV